ncbi:MAG TPA: permease [Gemmataceae bacterium]|nr:permease [Gemmataceae bacterium]
MPEYEIAARNFIVIFISILWEAMPFIVLGAVIAGFLEELVPQQLVAKIIPRSRVLAIAIGGLLGLLFPMCECGIIPVMRRLLRKGVPLSCCVCYLLAGPIINVVVMLSTWVAFSGMEKLQDSSGRLTHQFGGPAMMIMRMSLGYLVAFGTSLIVEWQYRKYGSKLLAPLAIADTSAALAHAEKSNGEEEVLPGGIAPRRSPFQRLAAIAETALHDFVDITVFLILGALLAALSRVLLSHDRVEAMSREQPVLAIAIMMGLAIVLCLCSEADAFVAASFVFVRPAAKLAFLVLGPMLDFKLYMMYTRVFRPRLIWTIIVSVVVQVFIYSLITHFIWETHVQHKYGSL